jgi:phage/plasmid primase-like uncharacterized protein
MKSLYEITRTLSGKNNNLSHPVENKDRNTIPGEEEQRARWAEHFKETSTQISHHHLSSSTSTPTLPARQISPRPSSPSSQARQQDLMEYHLRY